MAIEAAKNATARSASSDEDPRAALRKAWEKATSLRRLWEAADNGTREWFMDAVWLDLNDADHDQPSAIEALDGPAGPGSRAALRRLRRNECEGRSPRSFDERFRSLPSARLTRPRSSGL